MPDEQVREILVGAGLLPREMPNNYTFNKVREVLDSLDGTNADAMREAIAAANRLQLRGPLATIIFIKHHLQGAHEVEADRIDESEDGSSYAVLVYPEGELPIRVEHLPPGTDAGVRLRYEPSGGRYV